MYNLLQRLDRYLTQEPNCDLEGYFEKVSEAFSEEFFDKKEVWITDNNGLCAKWIERFYNLDYDPEYASRIIERGFNIFLT